MSEAHASDVPTSFGAFKPVGHLMVGLPAESALDTLSQSLRQAGWPADALSRFSPRETADELAELIDNASAAAGFGSEITLMRRYLALSREGCCWLLVKVDGSAHAQVAAELARDAGAKLAVFYRLLIVEELI